MARVLSISYDEALLFTRELEIAALKQEITEMNDKKGEDDPAFSVLRKTA